MVETSMNIFDLGVLIIVGLSALLSFFRGFVREILSLGAWMGAVVITLYMFPSATKFIEPHVGSAVIASGLASIGLFFVALISISIITGLVLKFLKTGAEVGLLDNLVGLCFGVARGVLIVAIAYFIMSVMIVEKDYPDWVKEAKTQPFIAKAATLVGKLTPSYLNTITNKDEKKSDDPVLEESKKQMNELIQKWDKKAKETITEAAPEEDLPAATLPSIQDLQQRIKEENEKR
jgi:membrane protein required for colicin V production